jgi:type IV pilus assembly protein PilX
MQRITHHEIIRSGQNPEQSGMILVLAMSMLFIMSIIGIMALNTSSTEIGISGNHKSSQEAFFAADRAVEYGMTSGDIYLKIGTGTVDLDDDDVDHATSIAAGLSGSGLKAGADNHVTFLTSGSLPPGSGSDPTYFQARYYIIGVTGQGPKNTESRIEAEVARVVPKS